jgi:zinc protease
MHRRPRAIALVMGGIVGLGLASPGRSAAADLPALEKTVTVRAGITTYQYRLANGLTVVLTPNPSAPAVSLFHWVKAGSLHETPGITGIAHLFEHMMFRPVAPGRPGFWKGIKVLGGGANASTRFTATLYTTSVPSDRLAEALKLEAERFQKLTVTDALLDIERKAVWSEYSTKMDTDPQVDLWDAIYRVGFPGHPYGWMVIGAREDLAKIKAEDCNRFFARYYIPGNTGLFVAGNFSREAALRWIVDAYSPWKAGDASRLPPPYAAPRKFVLAQGKIAAASRDLLAGYRVPEFDGHNHHLMAFANHVLYSSSYSLARRRLKDRLKMVSDVESFNYSYDSGMMKAFAVLLPGVSYDAVVAELGRLVDDFAALGADEYDAYLREYQVQRAEAILSNETLNESLALSWGKYGDPAFLAEVTRAPLPLPRQQVLAFLKKYLVKDNMVVVVHKTEGSR